MGEGEKAEKGNFERLEGSEVSVSLMDLLWGASSKVKGLKMVRAGGDKGDGLFREDFGLKGMVLRSGLEEMVTKGTESEGSGRIEVEGRNGSGEIAGWEEDGSEGERISWRSFSNDKSTGSASGGSVAVGRVFIAASAVPELSLTAASFELLFLSTSLGTSGTVGADFSFSTQVGFAWRQSFMMWPSSRQLEHVGGTQG